MMQVKREGEQYLMRMPLPLKLRLIKRAAENGRPVKSEVIAAIESWLDGSESLVERVARIERHLGLRRKDAAE